ncbi:T9SS type A sorting domain-containing protein [Seonamhaeicola algicola]|nr:T9SS type A sorting domain-containing protein [Seonamhaeicola algicola]
MKNKLLILLFFLVVNFLNAQIFYSNGGTTDVAAQQVGEPNQPNGTVRFKTAPTTPDNRANSRTAYENAGIPNTIIYNNRFLGDGTFARQISDMWATKQTAQNVRKVTSISATPPAASSTVIYINSRQILDNNRNRIASNDNLTFVFQGWINPGWPIAVGSNTTIWVDGTLSYDGYDAPRTATGAAFTPRPSKYDGVFNIRPQGAFKDEPTSTANKNDNEALLNQKFRGNNRFNYDIQNVNVYGTRQGQIIVAQGNYTDPSNQLLPQVNGITVMNASKINIEGVTIKNSFQGLFLSQYSFDINVNNNFIDNTLYRALHLKGAWNTNGWGSIKNNLLTNSKFDGIDLDSYVSGFNVNENVVIGARDRLLIWTEIDANNNTINNNVGIVLDAATEGTPLGNAGKGAYQENGTEASREGVPGFNGTNNNTWTNNHSFYAERLFDGFVMRKDRFIQFNTITFTNNYVWTTKSNLEKHNPKSGVANDVYYLLGQENNNNSSIPFGQEIAIRKHSHATKPFLQVNPNTGANLASTGGVNPPNEAWQTWERFVVKQHPNGGVAIYSLANNKYLQVNGTNRSTPLKANGPLKTSAPLSWEQFEWRDLGANKFALRSYVFGNNNAWVQCTPDNNAQVFVNGAAPNLWETFEYIVVPNQQGRKQGKATYTNEITEENLNFEVYPNPIKKGNDMFINTSLSKPGPVHVYITDLSGKTIYKNISNNVQSGSTLAINTNTYVNGVYILKVISNEASITKKIIVN